ncbi:MAG: hypothetical protein WAK60_08800, partial [Sedimentisphaerales bacterium]
QNGGEFEPRKVEIGLDNNRMIRIIKGLQTGEVVLLTPPLAPATVEQQGSGAVSRPVAAEAGTEQRARPVVREGGAGEPNTKGIGQGRPQGEMQPTGEQGQRKRDRFANMSEEERAKMRERFSNMTEEEKQKMRERRQQQQQAGEGE